MTNQGLLGFPSATSTAGTVRTNLGLAGFNAMAGGYLSGRYYMIAGLGGQTSTANNIGNGNMKLCPWFCPAPLSLSAIGAEITATGDAASKLRLGIYTDSGGVPDSLLLDAGTVSGNSATVQDVACSISLTPGLYWLAAALQGVTVTQPTVRVVTSIPIVPIPVSTSTPGANAVVYGWPSTASVTGALPSAASPSTAGGGTMARIHIKIA